MAATHTTADRHSDDSGRRGGVRPGTVTSVRYDNLPAMGGTPHYAVPRAGRMMIPRSGSS